MLNCIKKPLEMGSTNYAKYFDSPNKLFNQCYLKFYFYLALAFNFFVVEKNNTTHNSSTSKTNRCKIIYPSVRSRYII